MPVRLFFWGGGYLYRFCMISLLWHCSHCKGLKQTLHMKHKLFFFVLKESYVWKMYQERCWEFFPAGDCFRKQYEDQLNWSLLRPTHFSPSHWNLLKVLRNHRPSALPSNLSYCSKWWACLNNSFYALLRLPVQEEVHVQPPPSAFLTTSSSYRVNLPALPQHPAKFSLRLCT